MYKGTSKSMQRRKDARKKGAIHGAKPIEYTLRKLVAIDRALSATGHCHIL